MRHEDYPCCGCGPEGCIDFNTTVECRQCGKEYHPDPQTGKYCYRCQAEDAWHQEQEDDYGEEYEEDYPEPDYEDYDNVAEY